MPILRWQSGSGRPQGTSCSGGGSFSRVAFGLCQEQIKSIAAEGKRESLSSSRHPGASRDPAPPTRPLSHWVTRFARPFGAILRMFCALRACPACAGMTMWINRRQRFVDCCAAVRECSRRPAALTGWGASRRQWADGAALVPLRVGWAHEFPVIKKSLHAPHSRRMAGVSGTRQCAQHRARARSRA